MTHTNTTTTTTPELTDAEFVEQHGMISRTGKVRTPKAAPAPAPRKAVADDRLNEADGVVYRTTARASGTTVETVDRTVPGSGSQPDDADPNRWALVCGHGNWTTFASLREATYARRSPEAWCDECAAAAVERGYVLG